MFGVRQRAEAFRPLNPQSVALPHEPPRPRSACEQFRREPAISGLDWTFTPIPRSHKRFAHQHCFGPPPLFRRASTCPGIDRPASGIVDLTEGERTLSLARRLRRFGFPLASRLIRLTSPDPGTPWPVFQNGRQDTAYAFMPCQSVSNWFHVLFTSRKGCFSTFTHATIALSVSGSV
jgi:hypothetical protein